MRSKPRSAKRHRFRDKTLYNFIFFYIRKWLFLEMTLDPGLEKTVVFMKKPEKTGF